MVSLISAQYCREKLNRNFLFFDVFLGLHITIQSNSRLLIFCLVCFAQTFVLCSSGSVSIRLKVSASSKKPPGNLHKMFITFSRNLSRMFSKSSEKLQGALEAWSPKDPELLTIARKSLTKMKTFRERKIVEITFEVQKLILTKVS